MTSRLRRSAHFQDKVTQTHATLQETQISKVKNGNDIQVDKKQICKTK